MRFRFNVLSVLIVSAAVPFGSAADARSFGGYECTDDCSGHKAGYEWAERHAVSDEDLCPLNGNATSFWEGCKAYVEDPSRGSEEDDDGEEID